VSGYSERFDEALVYAHSLHRQQCRKSTAVPYVSHLLGVASLVIEDGGFEDQAIAALLHDAPEDQGGRECLEDIRARFGDRVATIVDGCTDTYEDPKPPWRPRKEAYLERLKKETDEGILRVSAADKLHNFRAMLKDYRCVGDELWDRFNAGKEDQLWYQRSLADTFKKVFPGPLSDELDRCVSELEGLATLT
jgi:(p)ppGpp synthase/HD superfamily hydrolase